MSRSNLLILGAALAVLTGACAKSPEAVAQDERIEASLEQLDESQNRNSDAFPQNESEEKLEECLEEEKLDMRAVLGDVEDTERVRLVNTILACDVEVSELPTFISGMVRSFELAISNQVEVSDDEIVCLLEAVVDKSDDPGRTIVVVETEADLLILGEALEACASPEYLAIVSGEAGPMAYGDDARMDLMFDECEAGDMRVCDLMYLTAAIGSEYEQFAYDCAGEEPATESSCSVDGEYDLQTGYADLEAPGIDVLVTDCESGDLTACDLLWKLTSVDDPRSTPGFNCGGRLVNGGLPDCRTSLGNQ